MGTANLFAPLCAVGFFARLSYALARSPVLPLFALFLEDVGRVESRFRRV